MSKIKLALEVVDNLRTLASSIEEMVQAIETNEVEAGHVEQEHVVAPVNETSKKKSKTKKSNEANVQDQQPEEKQPTLEEVRAAMADKSRDGHREAVKAIIMKYGAGNLSALDPKHYAAALKEVGEIK